ncbi:MAG TPA: ABC transporter ATP-binding protein [Tepidisphaeraceae bacterium]|nr:ABC transporter ATP-binding protein [Tepidisphaeraceae bacterium]
MKLPTSSKARLQAFRKHPGNETSKQLTDADNGRKSNKSNHLRNYLHWLRPFRVSLVGLFLLAVVSAGLNMAWPWGIKQVIDLIPETTSWSSSGFVALGAGILAILVLKTTADTWHAYLGAKLNARLIFRLRKRLFNRLLRLSLGDLGEMKTGGIVSRLSGDVDSVSGLVNLALINPAVAAIQVVLALCVALYASWQLALALLIVLPPLALVSWVWLRKVRPIYRSVRDDRAQIDGHITETFGGVRVIRAFRRESREELGYAVDHHTVIRKLLRAEWLEITLRTVWGLLIPGMSLIVVGFGAFLVVKGRATVGDIFMFQIYAVLLITPVWQIISSVSQTQRSLAAMDRVFEVLAMKPDKPDAADASDAPQEVRAIEFRDVRFEYRADVPVIRQFSLTVKGGQTVALVGPSGAGKTTVTDLVARFQDPTAGVITLNGTDLRRLKLATYRRLLAVVPQEVFLFDGTVAQNVSYGRRGATVADIEDACRRANAHEFIEKMPEGYHTLIGERGFKLSGGQRQRLSIARAILANPSLLILDEATSNLDTESEQLIQSSLRELFRNRTTFVIAHRLSTITHADLIVAMNHGEIIEAGTHAELMSNEGFYFEMVRRQQESFGVALEENSPAV